MKTARHRMKITPYLHVLERVALAIGAVCGLIALGWQIYTYTTRDVERLSSHLSVKTTDGGKTLVIVLSIANRGEKPVYIKDAYLTYTDNSAEDREQSHPIPLLTRAHRPVVVEPGSEHDLASDPISTDYLSQFIHDGGDSIFVEALTGRGESVYYGDVKTFFLETVLSQIPYMTDDDRKAEFSWSYD
jgi:hypothetical protein